MQKTQPLLSRFNFVATVVSRSKQPLGVRIMHWVTALLIIGMLISGVVMVRMDDTNLLKYDVLYAWHQSFGILTLAVVNVRLLVRLRSKLMTLPETIAPQLRRLARLAYIGMYALMLAIPATGFIMSLTYPQSQGIPFFGLTLRSVLQPSQIGYIAAQFAHWSLAYAFAALIVAHIAAALKHRFFDRPENDVLKRML